MMESPVRFVTNRAIKQIINQYCPKTNAFILDIGCGGGYHNYFRVEGVKGRYLGIDIKENNWYKQETQVNGLKVSFKIHDAEFLERLTKKFNFICSFQSLEHIKDDKKTMKGMNALLMEKGHILITVPSKYSYFLYGPQHGYRRYSISNIEELASQNDLVVEKLMKLGGIGTFVLHLVLWTIPSSIFKLKIYKHFRLTGFILKLENFATKVDKYVPCLEGGYAVVLKEK